MALLLLKCHRSYSFAVFFVFIMLYNVTLARWMEGLWYFGVSSVLFYVIAHYVSRPKIIECCFWAVLINGVGAVLWWNYFSPLTYQALFLALYIYLYITFDDDRIVDLSCSAWTNGVRSLQATFKKI